jgi:ferredoxin
MPHPHRLRGVHGVLERFGSVVPRREDHVSGVVAMRSAGTRLACTHGTIDQHDAEGFGGCTQAGECAAVCPTGIGLDVISRDHKDVLSELMHGR